MKKSSLLVLAFFVALSASGAGRLFAQQRYRDWQRGGVGITVFRDEHFRGKTVTFRSDVPDLRQYDMNDRITSLRIAPGESWEVCESANYRGRCQVFSEDESDLRRLGWTDRISSLRRVRAGGGSGSPYGKFGIVLYDEPFFRGRSVTVKEPIENLRSENFHDRAESVRVVSGTWELCSEPGFRTCQTVDRDVAELSSIGLNRRLSSARPAPFGPGGGLYRPSYPDSARLVLFEGVGFRGRSISLETASGDLGGFGGRARSLQVVSGTWLVCDRPQFAGRCREVSGSIADLDQWGLEGRIMSARPFDGN
ncbi:MAG TPA: beta/gamma crystallin-related protein [Thermoanaerobaculia bacterium]|nr:beta/gamma crystallin-related protein [Thermoanaerobaculia bacterium]